ncbi:unnamed protein product, partial [Porites evermanni]
MSLIAGVLNIEGHGERRKHCTGGNHGNLLEPAADRHCGDQVNPVSRSVNLHRHCAVACFVLKQQCSTNRCQCQKGGLTCTKLYACSDDDEPCEKALQEDDGDEYVDDNDESDNSYNN